MISVHPYEELGAMAVLSRLDPHDLLEAQLTRGQVVSHLCLFADWHAMAGARPLNVILHDDRSGGVPFAVLALQNTGQAGVAQAAFLSRNHRKFARAIVRSARAIRAGMPKFCAEHGIHRIEARSWRDHPTAGRFLTACGFIHETDMPGFGAMGTTTFSQFAWTDLNPEKGT